MKRNMGENVKNNIKNSIILIAILLITIVGTMGLPYITDGDKMWNFANTYKLYNGISLYNENNVIVTPLFFWIGSIIFKILGGNFAVYYIYHSIIMFILLLVTYKLIKNCTQNKNLSLLIIIFFTMIYRAINIVGGNYTTLALMFLVIGVNNLIKNHDKKINIVFQGIIGFLIFLTKQNIGIYYLMALFIYIVTQKEKLKNTAILAITVTISSAIFLIYEYCKEELYNFINYAFLGIGEFAGRNIILEGKMFSKVLLAIEIAIIFTAVYIFIINKKKKIKDEKLKILFIFSISSIMIEYPIFNEYHISIGMIIPSVMMAYILHEYMRKIEVDEESKKILKSLGNKAIMLLAIYILVKSSMNAVKYTQILMQEEKKFPKDHPFYGGIIYKGDEPEYDEIMQFIMDKEKESDVIIFATRANLYMIPLGKNNQNYDLPCLGNWGKDGENIVLEDVKAKNNTYFLMYEEPEGISTQESKKIKQYIIDNSRYEGNIGKYKIYYKY